MMTYRIDDMTCGHCADTITRAVRDVDAAATVAIDLAAHLVRIDTSAARSARFVAAITEAGYSAVPVEPPASAASHRAARPACCGCCG